MPTEFDHAGTISPTAFAVTLLVVGAVAVWLKAVT
jgi:hypothetical protein